MPTIDISTFDNIVVTKGNSDPNNLGVTTMDGATVLTGHTDISHVNSSSYGGAQVVGTPSIVGIPSNAILTAVEVHMSTTLVALGTDTLKQADFNSWTPHTVAGAAPHDYTGSFLPDITSLAAFAASQLGWNFTVFSSPYTPYCTVSAFFVRLTYEIPSLTSGQWAVKRVDLKPRTEQTS
jgi:hypothetical protein